MSRSSQRCIKCGSCVKACPVSMQEGDRRFPGPRTLAVDIPRIGMSAVPDRSELMLCSACHACAEACPMRIELPAIMMEQRERSFSISELRPGHRKMLDNIDRFGFSVEPSVKPLTYGIGQSRTAYFPGCIASWRERSVLDDTMALLRLYGIDVEIPSGLVCCGSPLEKVGDKERQERCVQQNMQVLERYDRVVSSCPGCTGQLIDKYGLDALHIVELIHEEGRPGTNSDKGAVSVALHQPCHLNRLVGAHTKDYSIGLVQELANVRLMDMENADRCCGAGGSLLSGYPDIAAKMGSEKVRWAKESGAEVLLASCPFCVTNLRKAGGMEVNDLVSFILSRIR